MFKKILIILFLFFSLTSIANAKDLKFAQIADIHYDIGENQTQILKWAVDELNRINDLDFVVFLGDNIDKSNRTILKSFLNIVSGLNKPYYIVLGNHDAHKVSGMKKNEYMTMVIDYNKYQKKIDTNYMFSPVKKIKCVVLDGVMPYMPSKHGQYTEDTLEFLKNTLTKYKKDKFIIFQHFPIYEPFEDKSREVYEKDAYLKLLENFDNIILISSGHYHKENIFYDKKNVLHLSSGSFNKEPFIFDVITIKLPDRRKDKNIEIDIKNVKLQ